MCPAPTLMSMHNALMAPIYSSHIGCVIGRISVRPCGCSSAAGGLLGSCCLAPRVHAGVDDQRDANKHDDAPDHADPDVPVVAHVASVGANDGVCKAQQQRQAAHIVVRRGPPPPANMHWDLSTVFACNDCIRCALARPTWANGLPPSCLAIAQSQPMQ